MRKILPSVIILLVACIGRADEVTLKNGDRVTGKITKKEGGTLSFKSDVFGAITIPWDQIARLISDEPLTVVLPDGRSIQGKLATAEKDLVVATAAAKESVGLSEIPAIRNAAEQRSWERLQNPGLLQLWSGHADFGVSLARGNAETATMTTAMMASRTTRSDRTAIHFTQIYSSAKVDGKSTTTAQAVRGGWGYSRNLHPRLFWDLFNDYEYDRFQDLDLRLVAGTGLGYKVLKTERTQLDLVGGGAYTHEKFATPLNRNSGDLYCGDNYSYKLGARTSLSQSFRMFNNLSETGEYRLNFDAGTVTALTNWLSLQLTFSDRYLSNPVGGRKNNDVLFTTGVRVNFAR